MVQRLASRLIRRPFAVVLVSLVGLLAACSDDSKGMIANGCDVDSDCVGTPASPYCSTGGVCVGCKDNSQCSGTAPVCESTTLTCQACSEDSQCASGVCLATLGSCAAPSQLLYVQEAGGVDTGECDDKAPCASINYAKNRVTAERDVIRVTGPLTKGAELQTKVYVNGDGSSWTSNAAPIVAVTTSAADVTIEGFSIEGTAAAFVNPGIQCLQTGSLRLHQTTVKYGMPAIEHVCKLTVTDSTLTDNRTAVKCDSGGSVTVARSEVRGDEFSIIDTNSCEVRLERNRIGGNPGPRYLVDIKSPSMVTIENNLIWDSMALTSSGISISNGPTGSAVRFNTIVNTAAGTHTGDGVVCDGTTTISSNVIAWQGGATLTTNPCARRYNAYDSLTPIGAGEGNTAGTLAALFVDPATDFHLAAGSPALGLADPADKVGVDLEGKARPTTGRLDAGAFEQP